MFASTLTLVTRSSPAQPLQEATIAVKVVPGSSRTQLAGRLGDRLKVKVAAAPEKGKANQAVCELIAETLGLPHRNVTVRAGHTNPEKTLQIIGMAQTEVDARLG